jgi:hypothetical protein
MEMLIKDRPQQTAEPQPEMQEISLRGGFFEECGCCGCSEECACC